MKAISSERFGSGTVVAVGMLATVISMLLLGRVAGWDATWRAFGVTPLQPPFFDMHVVNDYAACAARGVDPYAPHACNVDNFNIPRTWLWLGLLGLSGSDSVWLSVSLIAFATLVTFLLFRGRPWQHGVFALGAILSPSVMMGVERGNLDLLILSIVGSAALIYDERRISRARGAIAVLYLGVLLKLFPVFCISIAARFSRATAQFALTIAVLSLTYFAFVINDIALIRRNVPTTFILSYGYEAIFLGLDHVRSEAGRVPLELADTWLPVAAVAGGLISAIVVAMGIVRRRGGFCAIGGSVAGTAFLFGAGIYCGTFLLGTNFIYRLMFLLLCVPQLQDWQIEGREAGKPHLAGAGLYCMLLGVLWLNGNPNGHSIFLILPQLLDWLLFACLTALLAANFIETIRRAPQRAAEECATGNLDVLRGEQN
jgi:hypothetical protein